MSPAARGSSAPTSSHHLARTYPQDRIVVLDLLTYAGSIEHLPQEMLQGRHPRLRFWYGNVCNAALVDTLVGEADVVLHLAAETHVTRSIFDGLSFFQTDVLGTQTVANAVVKAGEGQEVHPRVELGGLRHGLQGGDGRAAPAQSDEPLRQRQVRRRPAGLFLLGNLWHPRGYRAPLQQFRAAAAFGEGGARFITSVLLEEKLTVHGTGEAVRDFIHVDDTCRALDLILQAPDHLVHGETFNVASGQPRSILDIARDVVAEMSYGADQIQFIEERPGQVVRHSGDWSKIGRVLGWKPTLTWRDGLQDTIAWYEKIASCWSRQLFMRRIAITTPSGKISYH